MHHHIERIIVKIDRPGKPQPANPMAEGRTHAASRDKPATPQQSCSTSVSLGSTATQLRNIESSMAKAPVADAGKVAEIKQAISDGRFKVNPEIVADRLIATVRDLINSKA